MLVLIQHALYFSQSSNLNSHEKTHEIMANKENFNLCARGIFHDIGIGNRVNFSAKWPEANFYIKSINFVWNNQFRGTLNLNNLYEINRLYEMMKEGINN